jgi:plasmid stabilization system protein ParE
MSFNVRFSPKAEETYSALVSQLHQRWGDKFVVKFENKIRKSINTISTSPYIYPIAEETTEIRRCLLHKNCSMLYKVYDDVVLIVCFWDNRQDPLLIS